jgi:uncharacterized membrane protein
MLMMLIIIIMITTIIIMIQFDSVLCYFFAESTATRPVTDIAQCRYWSYIKEKHSIKTIAT